MKNKKIIIFLFALLSLGVFLFPSFCKAMPPGTLLYRTTDEGKMYGYTKDPLIETKMGIMRGINPGHVGIYVGQEEGVDYVVEALASGVVKTKLEHFVNEALGEKLLGARIPKNINPLQQARVVTLAKNLAASSLDYDFDFKKQKGPKSGQWTCVGLAEKLYESANISNPFNIDLLEYDENNYGIDITPDGYDDYSFFNKQGDCFSKDKEFSLIAPKTDIIIPLPEKYGFDAGLVYRGDRYIFFPYTQYLQDSLKEVAVDRNYSSYFDSTEVRGGFKASGLVLRWSLVNNPVSAIKIAWDNVKEQSASVLSGIKTAVAYASDKLFPNSENKDKIIIASSDKKKEVPVDNTLEKSSQLSKMGGVTVADKNILATPSQKPQAQKESDSISREEALDAIKGSLASLIKTASEDDENQVSSQSSLSQLANNKKEEKEVKNSPSVINSGVVTNTRIIASNYQEDESQTDSGVLENKVVENSQTVKTLKISKIYSTLNDDFVEIYNPNNFSVNLLESSYRLEKAKTGLDPSIMIRIGNPADGSYPGGVIIPAHGYYLIVKESASNYYLTRADAIANRKDFSLSGLDQTVYLGIGAISSYQDEDIVDVIGFGPGAKYYLGSSPAPKIEDYHFLNRISYKDNNALDYNLLLSAEPAAIAAWQAENSQELEVPPPPDDPLPPPPDDPLPPPPDDPLPPPDDPLPPPPDDPLPPPPDDPLPPPPDDPLPPPDDPLPPLSPEEIRIAGAMTKVLINKIGVYGNDDYIELFNYSDIDIDLAENNFRLEKSKTTLDPLILVRFGDLEDAIYPGGTIIPAGSSYLVVRDKADARFLALADTIVVREDFNLFASGYSLYLGKGPISSPVDDDTIDLVGYGPESLYYFGSGPAPAILDGHYLERRTSSYNNCNDFVLIRDNYYNLEEGGVDGNEETEEFPFVFPGSQMSPGLKHLWNFDDCYTDLGGQATVGKWACGRKYGFLTGDFSTELDPVLDMSQFSVGFYYKADEYWPRVDLTLDKVGGGKFSLGVEPGYLVVTGAPGSGHFYLETDFKEGQWSYLSLVIDQVEGYWAVFSDGEQLMKKYFLAQLALADTLSLSGGGGYMYFDDLAVWDRPLLKEEIREIIANDLPLYPSQIRSQQLIPQLLYRWNFEEYGQDIAYDSQVNEALSLNSVYWSGRDHDNYAIAVDHLKFAEVDFASPFASQDLSLAFWWKNISHPDEGRVKVDLLEKRVGEELKKFGLTADYYRQYFSFNNHEGMIAEGIDGAIPNDGKWHHLALVYDSYRYRLSFYVDAVKKVDLDLVRMRDGEELVNSLRIYSDARKSAIDELMIFTGSLQQGDIDYIYHTTKTEPWPHEDVWE